MPVSIGLVNTDLFDQNPVTLDNGASWEIDKDGNLSILSSSGSDIATYSKGSWVLVAVKKKETIHTQLEEALELLSLVDNGKFTNQDDDWKERAGILLDE